MKDGPFKVKIPARLLTEVDRQVIATFVMQDIPFRGAVTLVMQTEEQRDNLGRLLDMLQISRDF